MSERHLEYALNIKIVGTFNLFSLLNQFRMSVSRSKCNAFGNALQINTTQRAVQ